MAKFNTNAIGTGIGHADVGAQTSGKKITNKAGGVAYTRDIKQEIATIVLNSMLNGDSYYQSEFDRLKNLEELISKNPDIAEFVAKTMVYTRSTGNLRSISHFLAAVLAENVKGTNYLRPALRKAFVRPDDLTETLALWNSRNQGKMVPNVLRRAFKDSLESYDMYQLKKYEGLRSTVKLRDVVKLAHPKGDFKALIEGTLPAIQTAQTVNAGSTGEDRAQNYKVMLQERKLGYMAALKNIKNIIEAGADTETIDMLCTLLRNEKACLGSRVLPFRFTQAYAIVQNLDMDRILAKKLIKAIEDGFIISARNIPIVEDGERVALLLDESGSMGYNPDITAKTPFNLGKTLMAAMLTGLNPENTVGYLWADRAREISVNGSPFEFIERTRTQGGGTDVWGAISGLIASKTIVDKMVIFTDMQMYCCKSYSRVGHNREFGDMIDEYRKLNPGVKIVFWNLEGYGQGTPIKSSNNIMEVVGYSDKMLEVVAKMLKFSDKDFLVKEIESIQL